MDSQLSWSQSRAACWGEGGRLALAEILHQPHHHATHQAPLPTVSTSPQPPTHSQSTKASSSKQKALSFLSHLPLSSLRSDNKKNTRKIKSSECSSITTEHSFSPHSPYHSSRSQIIEHSTPLGLPNTISPITPQSQIERTHEYQQQCQESLQNSSFYSLMSPLSAPLPISDSFSPASRVTRSGSLKQEKLSDASLGRLIITSHSEGSSTPPSLDIHHGGRDSELAPFPCTRAVVERLTKYWGKLLKYAPPTQTHHLIAPKSSKCWKSVSCFLTAIHPHNHTSPQLKPVLYTLHCFPTGDTNQSDTEQSRLRLEPKSIVCVLEHALAGESLILKVTGRQFDESCFDDREKEATWLFAMEGAEHLKDWMRSLKETIADLKFTAPSFSSLPALRPQYRTNTHSFQSTKSTRSGKTNVNITLESNDTLSDWIPPPISTTPMSLPSSSDFISSPARAPHYHHHHDPPASTAGPTLSMNLPELQDDQDFQNEQVSRNKESFIQNLQQDGAFLNPSFAIQTNRRLSSLSCSSHSSNFSKGTRSPNSLAALSRPFLAARPYPSSRGDTSETDTLSSLATSISQSGQRHNCLEILRPETGSWSSDDQRRTTGSFSEWPRGQPGHGAPSGDVSTTSSPVDPVATPAWDRRTTLRLGPSLPAPTVALPPLPRPLNDYLQNENNGKIRTEKETETKVQEEGPLDMLVNEEKNAWSSGL